MDPSPVKRRYTPRKLLVRSSTGTESRLIRRYKLDFGRLDTALPPPIPGVRQHATARWPPERCPKCGNQFLEIQGREAACRASFAGCGLITYHIRYEEIQA